MPFRPNKNNKKKPSNKPQPPPESEDDSSMDERGNVRNLIDYDYQESSDESKIKPHPRKAKNVANRRIKRALKNTESAGASSIEEDEPAVAESPSKKSATSKRSIPAAGKIKIRLRMKSSKKSAPPPSDDEDDGETLVDTEDETSEEEVKPRRRVAAAAKNTKKSKSPATTKAKKSRHYESEEEEEEDWDEEDEDEYDEDDYDEDEDEDYDDDEDDEDDEDDDGKKGKFSLMELLGGSDPRKPKKYNLKKESADVRRFVELVQKEDEEEDNIDNDITYFKSLSSEKRLALMKVLELKASPADVQVPLKFKILERVANFPDLARIAMSKYNALMNIDPSSTEYYKCSHWINGFTGLPLGTYKDLPVKLDDGPEKCQAFMETVHKCMNDAIYGHEDAKLQIMQFVSSWIANPTAAGNVLSIHGPMGVGKTTLIKEGVAKALGRPFHFITLGGATDASFLDGHSYTYEGSTWGKIADVLMQSKCMNPVIYFDELDKVSETPKGDEIMNMLIHLTDGSQNDRFQDKYFTGINLDLSRCLFIFSHNNHEKVNPILRDRMYNIAVKGFNTQQKLEIAEKYVINPALREVGLFEKVSMSRDILQYVIEQFTGGEEGIRELKRCVQTVVSKINLLRFFNSPKQVPFAIEGFALPFTVKKNHVDLFIKKKEKPDGPPLGMYC